MPEQDGIQMVQTYGNTIDTRGTSRGTDMIRMRSPSSNAKKEQTLANMAEKCIFLILTR